jgi:hypothetical protein
MYPMCNVATLLPRVRESSGLCVAICFRQGAVQPFRHCGNINVAFALFALPNGESLAVAVWPFPWID